MRKRIIQKVGRATKNAMEKIKQAQARHELFRLHGFNSFLKINNFELQREALLPDIKTKKNRGYYTIKIGYTKKTKKHFRELIQNLRSVKEEILKPEWSMPDKAKQINEIKHLIEFFQELLKQQTTVYAFSRKPDTGRIKTALKRQLNKKIEAFRGKRTIKKVFPR